MNQNRSFTCLIEDKLLNDRFSATVSVMKRVPIRKSPDATNVELADVFITPISGQHACYESRSTWKKTPAGFNVPTKDNSGSHNHFVVTDFSGRGLYIVRDTMRREVHRRHCSVWDLGLTFAAQVMEALRDFA
jgi:hypothetical protein